MLQYLRYYRHCIARDIDLPLPVCASGPPDFSLTLGPDPFPEIAFDGADYRLPDDTILIEVGQHGDYYRIRFPDLAQFWIDATARRIVAHAKPHVTTDTIGHLFVDQVMPRTLSTLGHTSLHASGAVIGGKAVLFLGQSGWGKSTLASEFHFNGYPGISDDVIFVERAGDSFCATQSYPGFRLWPDMAGHYEASAATIAPVAHYYAKQRIITDMQAQALTAPIQCAFLIAPPDQAGSDIQIMPLDRMKAFWTLTQQSFRLMPSNQAQIQREFTLFSDLAASIPFFSLSYPRQRSLLPAVREHILEHVTALE